MSYTFKKFAEEVLRSAGRPLTAEAIWSAGVKMGLDKNLKGAGKTPWNTISAQLYTGIRDNPMTPYAIAGKRPTVFGLKEWPKGESDDAESEDKSSLPEEGAFAGDESDLHALLSTFVRAHPHFLCHTKTISHNSSRRARKGYNQWLHPDIVGVYFPFQDREYQKQTLALLDAVKESSCRLYSFELKMGVDFSNLKECYFQALSNSSWAHEGYLVALRLRDDLALLDELRRLNNAFGIGVIRLDPVNIDQSEILIAAKTRDRLDWETIDRLVEENDDFRKLIEDIAEDMALGKIKGVYDKALSADDVSEYSRKKGFSPIQG